MACQGIRRADIAVDAIAALLHVGGACDEDGNALNLHLELEELLGIQTDAARVGGKLGNVLVVDAAGSPASPSIIIIMTTYLDFMDAQDSGGLCLLSS